MALLGIRGGNRISLCSLFRRVNALTRSRFNQPSLQALGLAEVDLDSLSKAHSLPSSLALTWRYRRLGCPVTVPCRFALAVVGYLPRSTASRVGYQLGESDRVLSGSGVVSCESFTAGWSACAIASIGKATAERQLSLGCNNLFFCWNLHFEPVEIISQPFPK